MKTLNDVIQDIKDSIERKYIKSYNAKRLDLKENGSDAKCKNVTINADSVQSLVLQLDLPSPTEEIHPLLSTQSGLRQKCDYIIICPFEGKLFILVIEMKSNVPGDWRNQCIAGECLTRYILSTIERVKEYNFSQHIICRHILFSTSKGGQRAGRFKKKTSDKSFKYDKYKSKNNEIIYWKKKACNYNYEDLRMFLT